MAFPVALLRHPPVRDATGRCYGRLDLPLATGWEAAVRMRLPALERLGLRSVWSSPLDRCRRPASLLAEALGLTLRLDDRLLELDFGAWDGRSWDAVPREALDRWAEDLEGFAPPGGESGRMLLTRVAALSDAVRTEASPCLLVTHGGPLRVLGPLLRGLAPDLRSPPPPPGGLEIVGALSLPTEA